MVRRNVNDVNLFGLDDLISAGGLRYWVEKLKSNFKSGFFILRSALINPTYITTASKLFISPIIAYHFQPVLSQILSHHKIFKDSDRTRTEQKLKISHRTRTAKFLKILDRIKPGPIKPEKYCTNSHRAVRGPSGAWIPDYDYQRLCRLIF